MSFVCVCPYVYVCRVFLCVGCVCVLPAPFNLTDTGCPRLFPDWPGASDFLEKFLLFY